MNIKMKPAVRQKTNIIIDIAMFVVMILLAIIGIVIRYQLIPGSDRWVKYGQNVELTIWGMDRHEWGLVHLIVGMFLIGLLVLHLIFHWKQIVSMINKLIPNVAVRTTLITMTIAFCTLSVFSPFFLSPKIGDPIYGKGQRIERNQQLYSIGLSETSPGADILQREEIADQNNNLSIQKSDIKESVLSTSDRDMPLELHSKEEHTLDIRGYHSFSELAEKYDISAEELKKQLGIPSSISNNERLGRVRRTYGFTMSNVEEAILKLQQK